MSDAVCANCGSNKIMKGLRITDHSHMNEKKELSVQIRTTDRLFMNKYLEGKLLATICGSCGFVELRVSNPKDLWEAYIKNN